jgi:hypothetical protein
MMFSLNVDVHKLEPENPWNVAGLHDPIQVKSGHTKVQYEETTPKSEEHFSGHGEVLEVRRDLLRSNEIVENFSDLNS